MGDAQTSSTTSILTTLNSYLNGAQQQLEQQFVIQFLTYLRQKKREERKICINNHHFSLFIPFILYVKYI